MTAYKKLEAWKKAMLLIKEVYILTRQYPKEELFGLTSQTKRAAVPLQQILRRAAEEIIRETRYSFFTFQEVLFMRLKHF